MPDQLTSERLLIRPRTLNDMEECLTMDRDPSVTKYIEGPWHNPELHRAFLKDRMSHNYDYPTGYWSISRIEKPDVFLGWVMVLPIEESCSKVEIGWRLTRATWGQGIATEATQRVLELVRKHMPNIDITASIHPENLGSIKVAEKMGLSFDYEELIDGVLERFYILRAIETH